MAMVRSELLELWHKKELELRRELTIKEVAEATGLNWETVASLKKGTTTRFDSDILGALCAYFGVDEGQPVPFLKVRYIEPA